MRSNQVIIMAGVRSSSSPSTASSPSAPWKTCGWSPTRNTSALSRSRFLTCPLTISSPNPRLAIPLHVLLMLAGRYRSSTPMPTSWSPPPMLWSSTPLNISVSSARHSAIQPTRTSSSPSASSPVAGQMGLRRSTVSWMSERPTPITSMNCLGWSGVDMGQKRLIPSRYRQV